MNLSEDDNFDMKKERKRERERKNEILVEDEFHLNLVLFSSHPPSLIQKEIFKKEHTFLC